MTQVDFYILGDDSAQARLHFACRLTDKIYRLGNSVFIHAESQRQAQQLDDMLWTFSQGSFVPHELQPQTSEAPAAVLLGHDCEPLDDSGVLINLATEVPLFFSRFERVAELINQETETRRHGRQRYGFYRDRGYALRTHEINAREQRSS